MLLSLLNLCPVFGEHYSAYGSDTDAYHVFRKMLDDGNPPDDWNDLLKESKAEMERLEKIVDINI